LYLRPLDPEAHAWKERLGLLEDELRSALSGDLGRIATNAGLAEEPLIKRALEHAPDLLDATATSWSGLEKARRDERRLVEAGSWPRYLLNPRVWLIPIVALGAFFALFGTGLALSGGSAESLVILGAFVLAVPTAWFAYRGWRQSEDPARRLVAEELGAADRLHRRTLQASVRAWITEQVNVATGRSYGTKLTYTDRTGLAEIDDAAREIPTEARERLLRLMERMPGGAIGLSGSRGAGKTTLMRSLCRPEGTKGGADDLALMVDAPVSYDAREFVLHLFAQACSAVLGPERVARLRGADGPFRWPSGPMFILLASPLSVIGLMLFAAGMFLVFFSALDVATQLSSPLVWGLVLAGAGNFLAVASVVGESQRRRRAPGVTSRPVVSDAHGDGDVQTAAVRLRQIWFQQSFTSGWSGSLKAPLGLEGGLSGSTEFAEQQLSFPEIVSMFRGFLEQVASSRQIRIGIDELDKMDDGTARRFLNEIKVVFRVPGCFFLVSISEDAMSFFERRGLPFRDVFDSSFDDVVQVPHLRFEISRELLDRRIVDLPLPFACLLHGISGGLPRDLIRSARDLVEMRKGTSLEAATDELMGDALDSKAVAARVAARRFEFEDHATLLIAWLDRLEAGGSDPAALLSACRDFEPRFLSRLDELPDEEDLRAERRELQSLGTQLAAFAYHAATMHQFFARFDEPQYVDRAISVDPQRVEAPSLVDRVANVTQAFSADINTVWETLSTLREDLDLETIPFPKLHLRDAAPQSPPAPPVGFLRG
jgi:hypothetical protein